MKKTTTKKPKPGKTVTDPRTWNVIEESVSEMQQTILDENDFRKVTVPASCCSKSKCKNHYSRGCFTLLYNEIARVVLMVKSVAMISSILQVRSKSLLNVDLHFGNCSIVNNFRSLLC